MEEALTEARLEVRKGALVDFILSQADWRNGKAKDYPEDSRNESAAGALKGLAETVRGHPATHERLRRLLEIDFLFPDDDDCRPGEQFSRAVSRWGFPDPGMEMMGPDEFLGKYLIELAAEDEADFERMHSPH